MLLAKPGSAREHIGLDVWTCESVWWLAGLG